MKNIGKIILFLLLPALSGCAHQTTQIDTDSFGTYTNTTYQFSMYYPAGWYVDEDSKTPEQVDMFDQIVHFSEPDFRKIIVSDLTVAGLSVSSSPNVEKLPLNDWLKTQNPLGFDIDIQEENGVMVSGIGAIVRIQQDRSGMHYRSWILFVPRGERVFAISFRPPPDQYLKQKEAELQAYRSIFDTIVQNFQFLE